MDQLFAYKEPWIWETGVILFLVVYGIVTFWIVNKKKETKNPQRLLTFYMLLRAIRFFVILSIVVIYVAFVRIEIKTFLFLTVIFYAIYLLLDTLFLLSVERKLKNKDEEK